MAGNVKINEAAIEEQILCLSNSQFKVEFETKTNNMLAKFKIKRIENKKEEQILLKYKCEQCDYTSDKSFKHLNFHFIFPFFISYGSLTKHFQYFDIFL